MAVGVSVIKNVDDSEKEIVCAICQSQYTEPKVLPCLHYYCKQCTFKLSLRTGSIGKPLFCSECHKEAAVPEENEDKLKTTLFVDHLKTKFSTLEQACEKLEFKCQSCFDSGTNAEAFCRQCSLFICQRCMESHKRMKVFDGHDVISFHNIEERILILMEHNFEKCPVHSEPFIIYCSDCNSLACHQCTVKDHNDHKFEFSAAAAPKVKAELTERLLPLKELADSIDDAMKDNHIIKDELETHGKCVTDTIETSFEELHQILEKYKQELLDEAESRVKEKTGKLLDQLEKLSVAEAEIHCVIEYTEQCLRHCTNNEMVCMHTELRNQIKEGIERQRQSGMNMQPMEEVEMVGVDLKCLVDAMQELCKNTANLTTPRIDPEKCTASGVGVSAAEVGKLAEATLTIKLCNDRTTKCRVKIDSHFKCLHSASSVECNVNRTESGSYCIQYTPAIRGRHELSVLVNKQLVTGSPFSVFVSISPSQLCKPSNVLGGVSNPTAITVNSVGEIIVSELEGDVVVLDKKGNVMRRIKHKKHNFRELSGISVDSDDNIYLVDTATNKIYKSNTSGSYVQKKKSSK